MISFPRKKYKIGETVTACYMEYQPDGHSHAIWITGEIVSVSSSTLDIYVSGIGTITAAKRDIQEKL